MVRPRALIVVVLQITGLSLVSPVKQQVQVSDSFLPVTMQIIAHLTDQMSYEVKDEPHKPTSSQPTTHKPVMTKPSTIVTETISLTTPSQNPTTSIPYVSHYNTPSFGSSGNGWWMSYRLGKSSGLSLDLTTPQHKPGLYAPEYPPKPEDRKNQPEFLLPMANQSEYTVIEPDDQFLEQLLLSAEQDEVGPILEPKPNGSHFLPPLDTSNALRRSKDDDEYVEDNLQYLSSNVRNLIRLANDPNDDRIVDVWEGEERSGPPLTSNKPAVSLSGSHLRLLLLYDLLSREAKKQKLSDFHGFSDKVLQDLEETSGGGARAQLSFALTKMLDRHDCGHDYANNRAREIVAELAKDGSAISSELRYLHPLVYAL